MRVSANLEFWTSHATLYIEEGDIEGHRLHLLALEKACPIRIEYVNAHNLPDNLRTINPENRYPFLTDKMLALWCPVTIENYIDERFPHPSFMPVDPKLRAQLRQICTEFRSYYAIKPTAWLQTAILQLGDSLGNNRWLCGNEYTIADITLAPWFWSLRPHKLAWPRNMQRYRQSLFFRAAFMQSVPQDQYVEVVCL